MKQAPEGKNEKGLIFWILLAVLILLTVATVVALYFAQRNAGLSGKKEETLKTYDRYYA
ncbi:MAG: hypothetical protein IJJ13_01905 [Lachnospiraceae bacterium]|nr:hypothetical protein [Lachnospiraceae bacterium]